MSLPIGIFKPDSREPAAWIGGNQDDFQIVSDLSMALHFARAGQVWLNKARLLVAGSEEYKDHSVAWDTS